MIILKSNRELTYMRQSGQIVAEICQILKKAIKPGITTLELDALASELISQRRAQSAFLGYQGFPKTICTSINEEVVHGIPGQRRLENGDILSVDVGIIYEGYCGDMAFSVPVGEVSPLAYKLIKVCEEAFYKGFEKAKVGLRLSDISHAIQTHVENNNFSVVRALVGHGIGRQMHEDPQVPNYGLPGTGPLLKEGMTLALEPMVNVGTYEVEVLPDGWTVVTKDRKLSAHFEHTIAITANGPEILTKI